MVLTNVLTDPLVKARRFARAQMVLQKNLLLWIAGRRPPSAQLLRNIFEDMGTTYIKLGQLITSMPSVFPEEYVKAFENCLDQTTPLPFSTIEKVLRKELGNPHLYFEEISETPLASASIAQVHAATLLTGENVVIKVQRPNAENIIRADLSMVHQVTRLLQVLVPRLKHLSLADMADEIRNGMLEECDFRQEAHNMEVYRAFLQAKGYTGIHVPKVYPSASSRRILTMERLHGQPLTRADAALKNSVDFRQQLATGIQAWFDSVQNCPIFHADLHSSNIMALDNGEVGFIDFGIVGRLSESTWSAIRKLISALPQKDFRTVAEALLELGATRHNVDTNAMAADLEKLYQDNADLDPLHMQDLELATQALFVKLGTLARRYEIKFPRSFTLLIKQFLYFDRLIQYLSSDFDPFSPMLQLNGLTAVTDPA